MTAVLVGLGLGLALLVAGLALCRLWVLVIRPDSIQGSDLFMLRWCVEENTRSWCGFRIVFDSKKPFEDIAASIRSNIAADLQAPDSPFRRGVDLAERRYVFYDGHTVTDVVEDVSEDAAFFQLDDPGMRELIYRLHTQRPMLGVLFDHTVWDGIRVFNETLTPALQSAPFGSRWLLKPKYYPVFSELLMVGLMGLMVLRWAGHRTLPVLESGQQHVLQHKFPISLVQETKTQAESKFASALIAIWARRLFAALPAQRTTLRFGLVIGMHNPRFRNNYSILTVDVRRADDVVTMTRRVDRQLHRRAIEVVPLYDLLSYVEMQSLFKRQMVDVLFSPAMFDRDAGPSLHIEDLLLYVVPTSMPMYCFACSFEDTVTVSTTWNSPAISLEQLASDATALYRYEDSKRLSILHDGAL